MKIGGVEVAGLALGSKGKGLEKKGNEQQLKAIVKKPYALAGGLLRVVRRHRSKGSIPGNDDSPG
jgi:hypothetical protein